MKKGNEENRGTKGPEPSRDRAGTLYVVSTPIGNLQDITLRAIEVLKSVALIASESATHTRRLCQHYGIRTRLTSYNQHNRKVRGPELIRKLKSGLDIALVTNAGTPCVSDPGAPLIQHAHQEGVRVTAIPGPSAVTAALCVSGLPGERFLFVGFLSNRRSKRKKELEALCQVPWTMIFFEGPHRIEATLQDLREVLGDRMMAMVREQTKLHEEVSVGPVSSIIDRLDQGELRGEFTLVVEGIGKASASVSIDVDTRVSIKRLLEKGSSVRDIARRISLERRLPYRLLYRECLAVKKEITHRQG
ncbi:MAG: 16S rRNA (cytidine(1402)-2'-O)-methyltransferase [Deltaproteobacteria bacterium]|nr:16S rRNA (cytidine(1402)-2'-O)-methyltransferase [Deltaproteobacteria bacterium]